MSVRNLGGSMARPSGPKTRCGGEWTESKFNTFIRNQLRGATRKWAPISNCKKAANVSRGLYMCAECEQVVPLTVKVGTKRIKNIFVDHIDPIVDPKVGFQGFDVYIERMFCEADNLQLLCGQCHDEKSLKERAEAKIRRDNEKL